MRRGIIIALAGASAAAQPAAAALVARFELNGTTANSVGNGVTLTNNGGTLGPTGITFAVNAGPTVNGIGALADYTIDVGFTLDTIAGFRKLIDFGNRTRDAGYYDRSGYLAAFPLGDSPSQVFAAGTPVRLTLSRTTAGLITAYVDGTPIYARMDATNLSQTAIDGSNPLNFFQDDAEVTGEASSGFVDYIRIFDTAIAPGEADPVILGGVPEPATWAMMLLGFGGLGYAMRRRVKVSTRIRFT